MPHKDPVARRTYHREYMRRYVLDGAKREQRNRMANERIVAIKRALDAYKIARGCADCGYAEHAVALDFDHVRGSKQINVCNAKSLAAAMREAEKCEVRCANCHRVRHAND